MRYGTCAALLALLAAGVASAENVDLVTLPNRDSVQLTIYNSEDLTLVKEKRFVTMKQGDNRLQFSWAGTLIDPTSVEVRALDHVDQIDVVDTVFAGQQPQQLVWNVRSQFEGQVPLEVSYFTSGLTWQMDYVAIADSAEKSMDFRGYVRVFNNSGEEYEDAQVRLIVGRINLVEKIAELAQRWGLPANEPIDNLLGAQLRQLAARGAVDKAELGAFGPPAEGRQIVKEGLSEYFMFSVEGRETINNGWSKRMQAVQATEATFDIVYRLRSYQYGPRPVRFFIWRNDQEHQLGDSPLPDGVVRVFRRNDQDGLSYLGQQNLNYVPVRAEIEVNLGPDDLVVFERRSTGTSRVNFAFHPINQQVTGWDDRQQWMDMVRNYRSEPIRVELRLQWSGDVEFQSAVATMSFDYNTVETKLTIPAGGESQYPYSLTIHQGTNAKQNRVRIIPLQR